MGNSILIDLPIEVQEIRKTKYMKQFNQIRSSHFNSPIYPLRPNLMDKL